MSVKAQATSAVNSKWMVPRRNLNTYAIMGLGIAFLTLLVFLPLVSIFQYATSSGPGVFWKSISSAEAVFSLWFSVLLAIGTTVINGAMGTVVAFMLVRHVFPLKGFLDSLVNLPVALPASVTGFTLLLLYGPLGLIGMMFQGTGITIMFAFPGILIAHVFMTLPFMVRAVGSVLQEVDRSQEEAAETIGANELQIFSSVILPSIKGGIVSGSVFTFARSLGEFGATIMVSGNLALRTQTAPLFIFSEFNKGNIEAASAMSVVLIIISFALFFGFKLLTQIMERRRTVSAKRAIT